MVDLAESMQPFFPKKIFREILTKLIKCIKLKSFLASLVSDGELKCKLKENLVNYILFDQIDKCKIRSQDENEGSFFYPETCHFYFFKISKLK